MTNRIERVNEVIKEEISQIFLKELDLEEGVLVTVTNVDTSRTLEHTKVWISVYPEDEAEKIFQYINRRIYNIQQIVNKRLQMRPVPKIVFKLDKSGEAVGEIEKTVKKLYNDE